MSIQNGGERLVPDYGKELARTILQRVYNSDKALGAALLDELEKAGLLIWDVPFQNDPTIPSYRPRIIFNDNVNKDFRVWDYTNNAHKRKPLVTKGKPRTNRPQVMHYYAYRFNELLEEARTNGFNVASHFEKKLPDLSDWERRFVSFQKPEGYIPDVYSLWNHLLTQEKIDAICRYLRPYGDVLPKGLTTLVYELVGIQFECNSDSARKQIEKYLDRMASLEN